MYIYQKPKSLVVWGRGDLTYIFFSKVVKYFKSGETCLVMSRIHIFYSSVICKQRLINYYYKKLNHKSYSKKKITIMDLFVKKPASLLVKNDKSFTIRPSGLQTCSCIILYRPDGRIVKLLSFFTNDDAGFFTNKSMIVIFFLL